MEYQVFEITPVPKPRQTRSSRWKKTAGDERYYAFKDEIRSANVSVPECGYHVLFVLKMPLSWSKKKKNAMRWMPHQQTPDKDNLEKALLDAMFKQDCHVWDGRCSKLWGDKGLIVLITGINTGYISDFLQKEIAD